MNEHLLDGDALRRSSLKAAADEVAAASRHLAEVDVRLAFHRFDWFGKGSFADDEEAEEDAQRPNFGLGCSIGLAQEDLGRGKVLA